MASSVQERLQLSRMPLDKWSTREQLCLASAVSCSGDQNWMSVSRTLKLVCGNGTATRPADWFSQKNCAVQYSHLLENVETPKRKKRTSESASGVSSPAVVETPTDLILRRLTEERIQELKLEIRKEQEEYLKICNELKSIQSTQLTEEELLEMWHDIEKQQERQRIEEMKLENQLREREQQRQEMQRNWRTLTPIAATTATMQKPTADTTTVDMDVEEIIGVNATKSSLINQQQQQQPQAQTGTSPLLSSLLKSPTSAGSSTPIGTSATTGKPVRNAAPTITTLLTSGSIPNANKPALIVRSTVSPNKADQLLKRPISGPPQEPPPAGQSQVLLSPSQAAPTLSMLLEKTKAAGGGSGAGITATSAEEEICEMAHAQEKSEASTVADSNNEDVPMDLEEDVPGQATSSNADLGGNDSDEPDPNEEQQLLEVFKNIGNIDELDIDVAAVIDDEEVDFLKGVDEDSPHETGDGMDFDTKVDTEELEIAETDDTKNDIKMEDSRDRKELGANKMEATTEVSESCKGKPEIKRDGIKVETISSDDSNDNIPLAAVASLEHKAAQDKVFLKEKVESAIKNDNVEASVKSDIAMPVDEVEDTKGNNTPTYTVGDDGIIKSTDNSETKNIEASEKSPVSEGSDVIIIPTDDESNGSKQAQDAQGLKDTNEIEENATIERNVTSIKEVATATDNATVTIKSVQATEKASEDAEGPKRTEPEINTPNETLVPPPPTISIADTDEDDSSATDTSSAARKEEKTAAVMSKHLTPQPRKSLHESSYRTAEPKPDEESPASTAVTPVRPPALRKLRERDRSESPMIENEASNAANSEHANNQRLRRRYSSTPVADSVPNSPASSDRDDVEAKVSKKLLLNIHNTLQQRKHAITLQRAFQEESMPKYEEVCLRQMDLPTIKKNIESGTIRSVHELQRDIMLVGQNGLMLYKEETTQHKAASAFMQECQSIREFIANPNAGEGSSKTEPKEGKESSKMSSSSSSSSSGVKVRSGSRKSQRIS